MHATKTFRMSGCLVALGFGFLLPGLLILLIVALSFIVGSAATGTALTEVQTIARSNAVVQLAAVETLSADFVETFRTNSSLATSQVDQVPIEIRPRVRKIVQDYNIQSGASTAAGGFFVLMGGAALFIGGLVSLTLITIGLLLIMRKKVWRCRGCGYVFERS